MQVPYVRQSLPTSCGAACLSMVLSRFGITHTENQIWQSCKSIDEKTNEELILTTSLADYAYQQGLSVLIGQVDIKNILQIQNLLNKMLAEEVPLIICRGWETDQTVGHYLVVYKYSENKVHFHNPENNLRSIKETIKRFSRKWKIRGSKSSGIFIAIFPKNKNNIIDELDSSHVLQFQEKTVS